MSGREFQVSPAAVKRGRAAGICGNIEIRLRRMARRSAPFTSELGNRRFHDFVLAVRDGTIVDVARLDPSQV